MVSGSKHKTSKAATPQDRAQDPSVSSDEAQLDEAHIQDVPAKERPSKEQPSQKPAKEEQAVDEPLAGELAAKDVSLASRAGAENAMAPQPGGNGSSSGALIPADGGGWRRSWRLSWRGKALVALIVLLAAGGGYLYWHHEQASQLPAGIVMTNGRLEAERVDVGTKLGGRVEQVRVNEGDSVKRGEVLAVMDTDSYRAQLQEAEAQMRQAEQALSQAHALVAQRQAELKLTSQELDRTTKLAAKGFATQDTLDQRTQARDSALAALRSATAQVSLAQAQIDSAKARANAAQIDIDDSTIVAPLNGRVQYRLALPGEVVAAGGRIVSLLDLTDVYMTVFLPTRDAGRLALGAQARLVFDAAPNYVVPAFVSYVAADAQFTPKYVETKDEREKLTYRVKLQIPKDVLTRYASLVKSGMTGAAYVKVSSKAVWLARLQPKLP